MVVRSILRSVLCHPLTLPPLLPSPLSQSLSPICAVGFFKSMDRGKRPGNFLGLKNNRIYMDLKDIIKEHALSFLPAKSLFRFQSVCRDWKLQISTPFFAHNQSLAFHDTLGFFYQTPGNPVSFVSCDPKSCGVPDPSLRFLPEPVEIRSSSNGLLCCQSCTGDKAYYICNPATRQWKKLPKPNADHGSESAVVLMFQPSLLNFVAEYKLVCAFPSNDFDDALEFEIYSSTEDSWKVSGEICFVSRSIAPLSGVHDGNNVIYLRVKKVGGGSAIIAYDVNKDRSQLLQGCYFNGTLGNLNGKLCSASVNGHSLVLCSLANLHSNTMTMGSYVRMWDEKQRIVLDSRVTGNDICDTILLFAGDLMVLKCGNKIYSSNVKTKETKAVGEASMYHGGRFVPYVNSLVCI